VYQNFSELWEKTWTVHISASVRTQFRTQRKVLRSGIETIYSNRDVASIGRGSQAREGDVFSVVDFKPRLVRPRVAATYSGVSVSPPVIRSAGRGEQEGTLWAYESVLFRAGCHHVRLGRERVDASGHFPVGSSGKAMRSWERSLGSCASRFKKVVTADCWVVRREDPLLCLYILRCIDPRSVQCATCIVYVPTSYLQISEFG
jgi:hypothetical protein